MRKLIHRQKIKNAMELVNVSQGDIATKTGKSQTTVSMVVRDIYIFPIPDETIGLIQSTINQAVGWDVFAKDGTEAKDGPSTKEGAGEGEEGSGASRVASSPDASNAKGA